MEQSQNTPLQLALGYVEHTDKNLFLTGKAGTGKTTFLQNLKKRSPKRMVVVAPTGVAAMNAGGVTIHSFFQIPFGPYVPALAPGGFSPSRGEPARRFSREKIGIIRSLDLLVIDEISMVRADVLDAIDEVLRRYKDRNRAFGGVQLLMIGDLQQLAPVVKDEEWKLLKDHYQTPFFFGSQALQKTQYVSVTLQHIYRQRDQTFINILNAIRDNQLTGELLQQLNRRCLSGFSPAAGEGYITLTTHNYQAQQINEGELQKLPGREKTFSAVIEGDFPDYMYPTEQTLTLKKGAQVMFAKNDVTREKRYFNGKIGTVHEIREDMIIVQCAGEKEPIYVQPTEWSNFKYVLNEGTKEIQETVAGIFRQYPLKLAWAITIHKSQGLTFDKAIIDANAAFTHGQVYVALSRCRSLEGLVLRNPLSPASIISNASIKGFTGNVEKNQPTPEALQTARQQFQQQSLLELFSFRPLLGKLQYCARLGQEHAGSLPAGFGDTFTGMIQTFEGEVIAVAEKFAGQMQKLGLYEIPVEENEPLQARIRQASSYFAGKIDPLVLQPLRSMPVDTDNKAVQKSVQNALEYALTETHVKSACLKAVEKDGFSVTTYLGTRAKASLETLETRPAKKTTENFSHPVHARLKAWRDKKAADWDVPAYMILPLKTMEALVGRIPRTAAQLHTIKGLGKKKIEQMGAEILAVIAEVEAEEALPLYAGTGEPESAPKAKPSGPNQTSQVSYDLFVAGKSVNEIAETRGLVASTIENHLIQYIGTGELDVFRLVPAEKVNLIADFFARNDTAAMGAAKAALGEEVSYTELRMVMKHLAWKGKLPG